MKTHLIHVNRSIRILLIIALIPIFSIGSSLYQGWSNLDHIKMTRDIIISKIDKMKYETTEKIIEEKNAEARLRTELVKRQILDELSESYSDPNMIEQDIKSDKDTKAKLILNNAIQDKYMIRNTENNRMWIANRNKIVADRHITSSIHKKNRSWEEEFKYAKSSELFKNTITRILNKDISSLLFISTVSDNYFIDPSYNGLINKMKSEGVESIGKYNILQCSYVYDNSDISGIPDIDCNGLKTDNDILVIVQQYSLGDAIHYEYRNIFNIYEDNINACNDWFDHTRITIFSNMVKDIIIMFLSFIAILGLVTLYQKWGESDGTNIRDNND